MSKKSFKIPLFYPYVTRQMRQAAYEALGQKIIGQGKTVDQFETKLSQFLGIKNLVSTNSGTSALELSYHLLDLKPGDEVISPVFTFTAATLPLIRRGIKVIFADITDNMLLDWGDAVKKITPKTKAIVNVHLFNQLSTPKTTPTQPRTLRFSEWFGVPIIGDAAQHLGKTKDERFTIYSFQATKILTTIDGGALVCQNKQDYHRAKLLRWYGMNRDNGDRDVKEAGFKYNMNNVTAAIGLAALPHLSKWQAKIRKLQQRYFKKLADIPGIKPIGGSPFLIHAPKRPRFMQHLAKNGIETGLTIRRNDIYSIFGGKRLNLPNMNRLEDTYLLLPCHNHMSAEDVEFICTAVKKAYV